MGDTNIADALQRRMQTAGPQPPTAANMAPAGPAPASAAGAPGSNLVAAISDVNRLLEQLLQSGQPVPPEVIPELSRLGGLLQHLGSQESQPAPSAP